MNVRINKSFLKELAKLPARERVKVEKLLFEDVERLVNPFQIPNLKKLKGYKCYYKIRFGDYRAGLRYENDTLYFERILHRKDIYKVYP